MSKHTPTPWNASCFVNRQSELWDACPANKLRDTWDVRTRDTDMAVTGWGCVEQSKETAARIVACVNAFHSPEGREIATENITEGLVWEMMEALQLHHAWAESENAGPDYNGLNRETHPHGEDIWRRWWQGNLDLCDRANTATAALLAKLEGKG